MTEQWQCIQALFCALTWSIDVSFRQGLWKQEMFLAIATTGAWPGFQPFGGWKGSGSSGKNAGGHYYIPLYMHE